MAQFAIIGLGSFGGSTARELMRLKHEVIGIDKEAKYVNRLASVITFAAIADATDEQVLKELNIQNCDAVVVAIGEDIEASILCVVHLKNLGVKQILVKAKTDAHHMILSHLQVTRIIHPEEQMGIRVAQALNYPMVDQYMSLGDQHFIVSVEVKSQLHQVDAGQLIAAYAPVRLLMIKRQGKVLRDVAVGFMLSQGDVMVLEGHIDELKRLARKFEND
ncbi:MAG: TrkA family potassium uptake protein [Moraxellaceae bacterium]|nr:MAG: TrkA family potassium uptake protein [Moraxellaceae bacterium]